MKGNGFTHVRGTSEKALTPAGEREFEVGECRSQSRRRRGRSRFPGMSTKILDGVAVLDLWTFVTREVCSALHANLSADVLKIDHVEEHGVFGVASDE